MWADSTYSAMFGGMLNTKGERDYLPLLGALLTRCTLETSDIADTAISQLLTGPSPQVGHHDRFGVPPELIYSQPTFSVVVATMLVGDGVDTTDALDQAHSEHVAVLGTLESVDAVNQVFGDLPNAQWSTDPPPDVPVLVLAGRYDAQTPLPWAEREAERVGGCIDELRPIDVNLAADFLQAANMDAFGVADPWTLLPPP